MHAVPLTTRNSVNPRFLKHFVGVHIHDIDLANFIGLGRLMTEPLWKRHHELSELDFEEALTEARKSLNAHMISGDRNLPAAKALMSFLVDYIGQHGDFSYAFSHAQYRHIAKVALASTASTRSWHNQAWDDAAKDPDYADLLKTPQLTLLDIKAEVNSAASYAALMKRHVPNGGTYAAAGPRKRLF